MHQTRYMQCDPPAKEAGGISVWAWGWGIWGGEVNKGASKCIQCQGMSDKYRVEKWIRVRWKVVILTRVIGEVLSEEVASELRSEWTKDWTVLGSEEEHDNQWKQQRQWPRVRSEEWYLKNEHKTVYLGQSEHVGRVRVRVRLEEKTPDHMPLTFEAHFWFSFQISLLLPCYSYSASLADPLVRLPFTG